MLTYTIAGFFQGLLVTAFLTLCLLLCLIVLIQKPRGGGLSGAFGGAGGGSQVFGGKSGDILTWITVAFFILFLVFGMSLVVVTRNEARATVDQSPVTPEATDVGEAEPVVFPTDLPLTDPESGSSESAADSDAEPPADSFLTPPPPADQD